MPTSRLSLLPILLAGVAVPALAQDAPPAASPAPEEEAAPPVDEGEEIVVTGTRLRGAVIGDIPPEVTLDAADIRAYGASNLAELLEALAPQTRSGRGRDGGQPVTLLNGKRISGFGEIRNIPPEAIERVDILPEEVALKYGYRADQRVVNFVTRERFRALTAEVEYGQPTQGGRSSQEIDLNILRINRDGRWSVNVEYERDSALLESQRDILPAAGSLFDLAGNVAGIGGAEIDPDLSALAGETVTVAGVPGSASTGTPTLAAFVPGANVLNAGGFGRFRSLTPAREEFAASGTVSRTIFGDVAATLDTRYTVTASESRFGVPTAALTLPSASPFSPFANDVTLLRAFDANGPLVRESQGTNAHLGLALNGRIADWNWSATANYDRATGRTLTDTNLDPAALQARIDAGDPALNPFGPIDGSLLALAPRDRASSTTRTANAELVVSGAVAALPAGDVSTTVRLGADMRDLESRSIRAGIAQDRRSARDRGAVQANVDVPIASRRNDVFAAIGDLSLNLNGEVERLSDFGTLTTLGYGINWAPLEEVRLIASVTEEDGAPSIQQLADPVVSNDNSRVFDFLRGETVDITRITGGNPALVADSRQVVKLGLNATPWEDKDLSLSANYVRTRIRNPIAAFPTATVEIEAAFPDRFFRDADGRLLAIDARPVNFARADTQELRWGVNFGKTFGTPRPGAGGPGQGRGRGDGIAPAGGPAPAANAPAPAAGTPGTTPAQAGAPAAPTAPGAGGRGRGGGPGGRGFGGGGRGPGFGGPGFGPPAGQGRLQLSLYHTLRLQDEILIREGVPVLDFLGGSAAGNRGGRPRHEVEFQSGFFKDGLGARLTANWQSGTRVDGPPDGLGGTTGDLAFSSLTTVNLRFFADLGQRQSLVRDHPFFRGTRVSLLIDNVFDSRQQVRDAFGVTPLGFQGDLIDPLGRGVRISFRKLFS